MTKYVEAINVTNRDGKTGFDCFLCDKKIEVGKMRVFKVSELPPNWNELAGRIFEFKFFEHSGIPDEGQSISELQALLRNQTQALNELTERVSNLNPVTTPAVLFDPETLKAMLAQVVTQGLSGLNLQAPNAPSMPAPTPSSTKISEVFIPEIKGVDTSSIKPEETKQVGQSKASLKDKLKKLKT